MKKIIAILVVMLLVSAPAVIAQDFCKGDFDYDGDVDAPDVTEFLNHFGRSIFFNPCPPDGPAPVGQTGQTISYGPGDDGDHEKGVAWPNPRFTDNGDGTVTDNLTGLIWLKNGNCFGGRPWDDALSDCNGLADGQCGLTDASNAGDWRLPNKKELLSVTSDGYALPAVSNTAGTGQWSEGDPFTNLESGLQYWSSTTYIGNGNAFFVNTSNAFMPLQQKTSFFAVWCVRGGHPGTTTTTVPPTTTTSTIPPLCNETTDCGEGYCCGYASVVEVESGDPLYCTPKTNDAICFFCESQSHCAYSTVYTCCCSECPTVLPPSSFCINQISCLLGCESTCVP